MWKGISGQTNVYSVGANSDGQLCIGNTQDQSSSSLITLSGAVLDIAAGAFHSLFLMSKITSFLLDIYVVSTFF